MHQHVAQFFHNLVLVVSAQRVAEFEGLFYGVRPQALVGLLFVPRAFFPQLVQHVQQSSEGLHLFFSCMHSSV